MSNKNMKMLENVESKTKIYLLVIAIILVILCINVPSYIFPSIILYLGIVLYTIWIYNKRKGEVSNYINELTITMDSAAKNTLINSPFPLIILETDGNVIWRSSKFNKEFANIGINKYIDDITKEIKTDIDNNNIPTVDKEVQIEEKTYHIIGDYVKIKQKDRKKTSKYMTILYFIDITELKELSQQYNNSKTCIGIIMIDNYDEIVQRIATEERPQIMAAIEKKLYNWASKTQGIMIKTERDTFVYVFEQKHLEEMQIEKFSILDEIKEIKTKEKLQITLSIAISNDGNTNYEKYQEAQDAMNIALRKRWRSSCIKNRRKIQFLWWKSTRIRKKNKSKGQSCCTCIRRINKRRR